MAQRDALPIAGKDCPTPKRICNWLDGRCELDASEVEHIATCPACAAWLEQHTAAPELQGFSDGASEQTAIFDHEPEFKELQERLADSTDGPTPVRLPRATPHLKLDLLQLGLPPRYTVRRPIASGGIASVFLAFDSAFSQDVAIKVLKRESASERQRFLREAKILAELEHPNIVRVYDVGGLQSSNAEIAANLQAILGLPYIVMEYVSGGTAASLVRGPANDFRRTALLISDAASGLEFAHRQGLIHRDVKPSNLLIEGEKSNCKVADFGLARYADAEATQITRVDELVGTPAYMSPEQVAGPGCHDGLTNRTDIYSLGATLYSLLTGQPPLQGNTAAILRQIPEIEPVAPRILNPEVPRDLESICLRAIEKDPAARYQTMQELKDDLHRYLDGKPTVARPLSPAGQWLRWSKRNRRFAATLLSLAAVLLVLGVGASVAAGILWKQKRALVVQQQRTLQELSNKVAVAEPEFLPVVFSDLNEQHAEVVSHLEALWTEKKDRRSRLNIACALNLLGVDKTAFLVDEVGPSLTRPGQCLALCMALSQEPQKSLELIKEQYSNQKSLEFRAKLAIIGLHLGSSGLVKELAEGRPEHRTELIHMIPIWHGDLSQMLDFCANAETDPKSLMCVILGLGLLDGQEYSDRELINTKLMMDQLSGTATDNGVRAALRFSRRQLPRRTSGASGSRVGTLSAELLDMSSPESLAAHQRQGFRLLRVPAGTFEMGSDDPRVIFEGRTLHPVTLTKDFWLADQEVSVGLFRKFLEALAEEGGEAISSWSCDEVISPSDDHPAQQVTWFEAVEFCNWLSEQHGYAPYYRADGRVTVTDGEGQSIELSNWVARPLSDGYRLPTEAEFEYACRAGTKTLYSFGDDMRYFEYYVAWSNNTRIATAQCGDLMPNPWGFFEMHGNVWEWCDDWYRQMTSPDPETDPLCRVPNANGRSFRGGGVCTYTGYPYSSSRGSTLPGSRFNNLGFRVARSIHE